MKYLFGDIVKISKVSVFRYPEFDEKPSNYKGKHDYSSQSEGVVLRKTRKATGHYQAGCNQGLGPFGNYDAEPPMLIVEKWHSVYEVAVKPTGRLVFVLPENMEKLG